MQYCIVYHHATGRCFGHHLFLNYLVIGKNIDGQWLWLVSNHINGFFWSLHLLQPVNQVRANQISRSSKFSCSNIHSYSLIMTNPLMTNDACGFQSGQQEALPPLPTCQHRDGSGQQGMKTYCDDGKYGPKDLFIHDRGIQRNIKQ